MKMFLTKPYEKQINEEEKRQHKHLEQEVIKIEELENIDHKDTLSKS